MGKRGQNETIEHAAYMVAEMKEYPAWVCSTCGEKFGRRECGVATWHVGICGVCGIEASVTEPRDYGHLLGDWPLTVVEE